MTEQDNLMPTAELARTGDAAAGPAPDHGDPVFRVVTYQGHKHAFKLEDIFWKIIELAAAAQQKRIGAFISSVLHANADTTNKASVLRVYAAEWLSHRLVEAAAKSLSPRLPGRIVGALPVACFTLDNDNRITSQNDQFMGLLRGLIDGSTAGAADAVRVHFQSDIRVIRETLTKAAAPFVDDTIHLQYAVGSLHKAARVISIDTAQGTSKALLVLILN